jgi:hypothetical protein
MPDEERMSTWYPDDPISDYLSVIFAKHERAAEVIHTINSQTGVSTYQVNDPITSEVVSVMNVESACEYMLAYGRSPGAFWNDTASGNLKKRFFMSPHTRSWLSSAFENINTALMITPASDKEFNVLDVFSEINKASLKLQTVLGLITPQSDNPINGNNHSEKSDQG